MYTQAVLSAILAVTAIALPAAASPVTPAPFPAPYTGEDGWTVLDPTVDYPQFPNITLSGLTEKRSGELERRQTVEYKPTFRISAECPTAGNIQRTQIYNYDVVAGRIFSTQNIQNAETIRIVNLAGTQAQVLHQFSQSFGNKVCCYSVAHVFTIGGTGAPTQNGDGAVAEVCIGIGQGGCATLTTHACQNMGTSFTFTAR